jgi:hypothetical protein
MTRIENPDFKTVSSAAQIMKTFRLGRPFLLSLIFCVSALANARIETVRFQSKLVNTTLPYNVILPDDYDASPTTRYPVLYLVQEVLQIAAEKMRLPRKTRAARA